MIVDSPSFFAFLLAFAGSAASLRLALPYAGALAMATPVARSSHSVPVPQSGGLFVMASVTAAVLLVGVLFNRETGAALAWLAPALLLAGLGWLDDRIGLAAMVRLVAYALVCATAVLSGLVAPAPLTGSWPLDGALAACFLVAFVNVTNFMDGIDGLVVVQFAPALLVIGGAALVDGESATAVRALAVLGGLAGFFVYNRPKARIFLGDSGSISIGFLAGCLLIDHARGHGALAAMILPLYFVADAGWTLARRSLNRERIWEGHRQHFYQRALDGGQSNWSILARVGACNLVLCALSLAAGGAGLALQAGLFVLGVACVGALLLSLARGAR